MQSFLTDAGYWALIVFAFVQACCIPISSEITFGFAGVLAYQGHLSLPLVIVIGTLGELAGSSAAYGLGRLGGRDAVERYRKYLLMTRKDVDRAERFFAGRGAWSVALARIIPLVRAFTGLVAGLMEVPAVPFEIFNLIGTVIWATALSVLGYELGSSWDKASKSVSHASDGLAILVLLMLIVLVVHKALQVRKERAAEAGTHAAGTHAGGAHAGGAHAAGNHSAGAQAAGNHAAGNHTAGSHAAGSHETATQEAAGQEAASPWEEHTGDGPAVKADRTPTDTHGG
jgi:membrane protein DedA with SNARE-associated domain